MKSILIPEMLHNKLTQLKRDFFKEYGRKITIIDIVAKAIDKIKLKDLV